MKWFILFVGIIVVCFVVALILGLASGAMSRATSSLSHEPLPDEPIHDADFDDLAFDVSLRGYRMSQVDGVVDRLRRELREKDEEIAVLRGEPGDVGAEAPVDAAGGAEPESGAIESESRTAEPESRTAEPARDAAEPARDPAEDSEQVNTESTT